MPARPPFLVALAAAIACALLAASPAAAATFSVTNTQDLGGGSLRQAITDANANPGADTIQITATGTLTLATPLPAITDPVTIAGPGQRQFTIDGGGAPVSGRVLDVTGGSLTLTGVTVTDGAAPPGQSGGAILSSVSLTLRDLTVSNSSAATGDGGGVDATGGLVMTNATFTGNSARRGGALAATGGSSVSGSAFTGNHANGGDGGAAFVYGALPATISGSTFTGNTTTDNGGAVSTATALTVDGTTITGNMAGLVGGGLGVVTGVEGNNGSLTLRDSTLTGNMATTNGGGLGLYDTATLISDTVAGNSSGTGANLAEESGVSGSTVSISNTIVSGAQGGGANCSHITGTGPSSGGFNLEDDAGQSCAFTAATDQSGIDPQLGPLADNGGPNQTMALAPTSPAVDKGTSAGLPAPATDERGVARPFDAPGVANAAGGDGTDIGAYEVAFPTAVTGAASGIGTTGATVAGTATDPSARAGQAYFLFGPDADPTGTRSASVPVAAGASGAAISAALSGLAPNTRYHFRLVVDDGDAVATGADATFTTAPLPPAVQTNPATQIRRTTARLQGSVNPEGVATTYGFQYGRTTAYGNATTPVSAGAGNAALPVSAGVSRLRPNTTYHFRIVATSAGGTTAGADRTFRTGRVAPPPPRPGVPIIRLLGSRLTRASAGGDVVVPNATVICPRGGGACELAIDLKALLPNHGTPDTASDAAHIVIARRVYRLAPGTTLRRPRLRLTPPGRRLLVRHEGLRTEALLRARNRVGSHRLVRDVFTILAPRRRGSEAGG